MTNSLSQYTLGIIFAVVASAVFGLIPLFSVPLLKAGMTVSNIVCYRFALSTIAMSALLLARRTSFCINWREYKSLFLLSFFYGMTALLLTASYKYIPTGMATTIHFLYPVWVTLLTVCLFKEKISKGTIIAMILAIAGVAILSLSGTKIHYVSPFGLMVVLGTVVAYGSYLAVLPHSAVKEMDGLKITFWLMLNCTMIFALNILLANGFDGFHAVPDTRCWLNLALVSLLPTLVSNLTLIQAIKRIGSAITSVFGSLEPLTAVIIGLCIFHETGNVGQFIGMAIIIGAVGSLIFLKSKNNNI